MIKTRLVGLLSHAKKYIVYTILWQWAALLSQVIAVFTVADLLERVVYGAVTAAAVKRTIFTLAIVVVIRFFCERMGARSSYLACVDVKRILREKIYEKMLKIGASYSEQVSSSEVVQVSTEGVEQLETYFGKYLSQLFYSLLAPLTLFAILCRVSLKASVVLLICVPLIPVSIVVVQKIAKKLLNKYWSIYTGLGDSFLENLQGLTTLKIYQADQQKADEMDVDSQNFRRITMKVLTMQLNSTSVIDIVAYGGAAVGMAVAVSEFLKGNLTVSGTLCIVLLASEFFLPLRLLGSFFHIAMNGMAASDKIFKILDLPEPQAGERTLPDGPLDVVLEDVHFSYEEDREILKGIDLTLPAGSFVSLVGESGCGKSTIAGILAAKNRGYTGHITLGGVPLSEVAETDLMKHVVLVRHNSYLFKGTVEVNLRMAKPDATKEEMEAVLQKVNLLGFLQTQNGLQTGLLEKAGNLSGGQCQRLVIARALLRSDSAVYIFDEAASNIDVESEELIMNVIHELAKTKTVLLISHRLANVVQSDQIYFLKNGTICERGTHAELMEQNGAYRHLYDSQMVLENYGKKNEMLKTIPPIPLRYIEVKDSLNPTAPPELKQTISPAVSWERINNIETPQLYPVFPWRIYGVGKENLELARNTYFYDPEAINFRSHIGWKQDNIWAACLGLTEEAKRLSLAKLSNGPHRFPAFWGPGYDWTPDHNWGGSGMIGLQEMLLQTNGNQILLFPAWPKEWDIHFKLYAPGETTVEATLKDGKVTELKVSPESRKKDIIIMIEK